MDGLIALALAKNYTDDSIVEIGRVLKLQGIVDTYSQLPTSGNKIGDVWLVRDTSSEYVWLNDGSTERWELFGNIHSTNKSFPSSWVVTGTKEAFCQQVIDDPIALVGDVYVGGVEFTNMPEGIGNGEAAVTIFNSTLGGKVIHIDLYSATTAPYYWSCNYFNGTSTPWVATISDVQVDGTSVLSNGIASIDLTGKQDKLTAGDGISINNTTISVDSTVAKKSDLADFRGNWNTWDAVPTDTSLYPADSTGSKVPTTNDYIIIKDASGYASLTKKCVITKAASSYTFVVTYPDSTTSTVTLSNGVSGNLGKDNEFILTAGASTVHSISCIYNTSYNGTTYNAETAIVNTYYYNEFRAEIYLPEAYTGTWQFKYIGTWATDGKNGWKPEYQPLWKDGKNVSVASTGTSSTDVRYITIEGVESRFASVALRAMKTAWKSSSLTTAQAATAILNDADVIEGDGFLGTVYWSDLPIPPGTGRQAEVKAFILKKDTGHKIVQFECTSGTTAPYAWFFNSYEGKWRGYVPVNDTLSSTSGLEALSAKQGKVLSESKLDIMPGDEHTAGNAYNLPYYFETSSDADKVTVTAKTVTLDGNKTHGEYSMDVTSATTEKAGLMSAADKVALSGKQDKLTAGVNINISDDSVISSEVQYITLDAAATSGTLTDEQKQLLMNGANIQFVRNNLNYTFETSYGTTRPFAIYSALKDNVYSVIEIDVFNKAWNYTQREFQKKLTAGDNITIDENNVISASSAPVVEFDEKTIIKGTDNKYQSAIGGWKETTPEQTTNLFIDTKGNGLPTYMGLEKYDVGWDYNTTITSLVSGATNATVHVKVTVLGTVFDSNMVLTKTQSIPAIWESAEFTIDENIYKIKIYDAYIGENQGGIGLVSNNLSLDLSESVMSVCALVTGPASEIYHPIDNKFLKLDNSLAVDNDNKLKVNTDVIQPKLTAGTNITIDENNIISATGGGAGGVTDVKLNGTSVVVDGVANVVVNPNPTTQTTDPLLESVTIGTQKYRIPAGGGGITIDDELSPTSTNPVQNKIVTDAIGYKASYKYVNDKVAELTPDAFLSATSEKAVQNKLVTDALGYKADNERVNEVKDMLEDKIDLKSDKTYVDTQLALKSDKSYVDAQLALKSDKTYVDTQLATKIDSSKIGIANGVAALDTTGKVPTAQLPELGKDNVLEYANISSFPTTGEVNIIYIAKDTNKMYRWDGSAYVLMTADALTSEEITELANKAVIGVQSCSMRKSWGDQSVQYTFNAPIYSTWGDFVNSSLNIYGFTINSNGYIVDSNHGRYFAPYINHYNKNGVTKLDIIETNTYWWIYAE